MKTALLIIDVQNAVRPSPEIVKKIEMLQADYANVFVSKFVNKGSYLLKIMNWDGYDDDSLAFRPAAHAVVFEKNIYSSYINALKDFDEVHLCGSENDAYHQAGISLLKRNIGEKNVR